MGFWQHCYRGSTMEYHYKMGHGGPYEWYGFWRSPTGFSRDMFRPIWGDGISQRWTDSWGYHWHFNIPYSSNVYHWGLKRYNISGTWYIIAFHIFLYFECQLIEYQCQYRSNKIPAERKSVAVHSQKQGLSRQVVAVETCKIQTIEWACSIGRMRVQRNICVYIYVYVSLSIYIYHPSQ